MEVRLGSRPSTQSRPQYRRCTLSTWPGYLVCFCSRVWNTCLMVRQLVQAVKFSELLLSFVYFQIYVLAIITSNLLFTSNSLHTYKPLFAHTSSRVEQVTRCTFHFLSVFISNNKRCYETKGEKDGRRRHLSHLSLVSCFCSTLIYGEPTCPTTHYYFCVEIGPF